MTLPRGGPSKPHHTRTATARWAKDAELLRHRFKGDGDLYLGHVEVPSERAAPTMARLAAFETSIASNPDLAQSYKEDQARIARSFTDRLGRTDRLPLGIDDDRHVVTAAGSRAGKGVSSIIPNLCLYPGSCLVIDPKGENARITAARRGAGSDYCEGMGQNVHVLDPYGASGIEGAMRAAWNPLDLLKIDDDMVIDKAASIASALVVPETGQAEHFGDTARILVKALILKVALDHDGLPTRTLITVHDLLTRGARDELAADRLGPPEPGDPDPMTYLLRFMAEDDRLDGVIAAAGSMMLDMGERERGSVLSTARRNLEWLERKAMRGVVERSTFDLSALKTDPRGMSLYLSLPPQRMIDCGRWMRVLIGAAMEMTYAIKEPPATGKPILFLLEEFPTLKHMEIIETAAGYAAGFGVKLWIVIQDLSQLKRWYKEGWETFIGNAGVIQAFGNSDNTTLEYLSKRLGQIEVTQSVVNTTTSLSASSNDPGEFQRAANLVQNRGQASLLTNPFLALFKAESTGQSATTTTAMNQHIQKTPLLLPDEIERHFRREAMTQIVSIKGEHPFKVARANYYDAPEFMGLFEPDRAPFLTREQAYQKRASLIAGREADTDSLIAEAERFMDGVEAAIAAAMGTKGKSRK